MRLGVVAVGLLVLVTSLVVQVGPRGVVAQEPLSISGTLWWDKNGDGLEQVTDGALGGIGVALLGPANTRQVMRTDLNGAFTFAGLSSGEYVVSASESSGLPAFYMTYPETRYEPPFTRSVSLGAQSVSGVSIGLYRPEAVPMFAGTTWIDATPVPAKVQALIDGVDCTGPAPMMPPSHSPPNTYWLKVLSSEQKPGCGEPGDSIMFTVNGLEARQRGEWQPVREGESELPPTRSGFDLTVGPEFMVLYPYVTEHEPEEDRREGHTTVIVALIDGRPCGSVYPQPLGGDYLIIRPLEMPGGCGYQGALITFAADGYALEGSVPWHDGFDYDSIGLRLQRGPASPKAGPAFAYYTLDILPIPLDYIGSTYQSIEARINSVLCGGVSTEGPLKVELAVAPEEVVEGCGLPGATVSFFYRDQLIGTAPWLPGYHSGPDVPPLANVASTEMPQRQILPPGVGDAGLR